VGATALEPPTSGVTGRNIDSASPTELRDAVYVLARAFIVKAPLRVVGRGRVAKKSPSCARLPTLGMLRIGGVALRALRALADEECDLRRSPR
jgi:hypothetical protein